MASRIEQRTGEVARPTLGGSWAGGRPTLFVFSRKARFHDINGPIWWYHGEN